MQAGRWHAGVAQLLLRTLGSLQPPSQLLDRPSRCLCSGSTRRPPAFPPWQAAGAGGGCRAQRRRPGLSPRPPRRARDHGRAGEAGAQRVPGGGVGRAVPRVADLWRPRAPLDTSPCPCLPLPGFPFLPPGCAGRGGAPSSQAPAPAHPCPCPCRPALLPHLAGGAGRGGSLRPLLPVPALRIPPRSFSSWLVRCAGGAGRRGRLLSLLLVRRTSARQVGRPIPSKACATRGAGRPCLHGGTVLALGPVQRVASVRCRPSRACAAHCLQTHFTS